mmetsp:Transcript_5088/g.7735  ORF Transcript_5088/g.7735 Transcript_5088/m.7735 type:complete len:248 (-) Transcript_5088:80-823(-)|eukprot:CAMPEP_0170481874 /NCGR_PEP_ID=MMETSP0208-20121228/2147_1 /TAXON_ID=197538 /ORGANISM="Strombidium inclinatum, Strain S3" /LENGTH=247 /DNA_ID=CAMNT_0010754653 /DNA_START=48 /DNA_END=791 /DNA_ORIENTATION=+
MFEVVASLSDEIQVGHDHSVGQNRGSNVVLDLGAALGRVAVGKRVGDLIEIGDSAQAVFRIVGEADIEEAGVFLRSESVHVTLAGAHEEEVFVGHGGFPLLDDVDFGLGLEQLGVLVVGELVVLEFLIDLVELVVAELAKHQLEVHAHVRVVVQGHHGSLLDEEKHKSVVVVALNHHAIQVLLEVVRVTVLIGASDAQATEVDGAHLVNDFLAHGVHKLVVEELDLVVSGSGPDAHFLDGLNEGSHS